MKNFYTIQEVFEKMNEKASFGSVMTVMLQIVCILALTILFIIGVIAFIAWDFAYFEMWFRALLVFGIIFILNLRKW